MYSDMQAITKMPNPVYNNFLKRGKPIWPSSKVNKQLRMHSSYRSLHQGYELC